MSRHRTALLLTLLVILFWGGAASAFKLGLRHLSPYGLMVYSVALSTSALAIVLLIQGKFAAGGPTPMPVLAKTLLLGVLNPFCYYVVLFKAYALLPGQIAMSLNYGWPLVLTLLSVPILGQKLSRGQLIAVAVSFLGAVVIATRGQFTGLGDLSRPGLLLAGGSTLIWASFWLINARDGHDPVIKLFLGFCSGLICTLAAIPLFGPVTWPPAAAWPALVYIGLFEMGITFVLWLTALQLAATAARLGNLIYLTPFLSLLFLRLVVGEPILPATLVGLSLIVASILFQEWQGQRVKRTGVDQGGVSCGEGRASSP